MVHRLVRTRAAAAALGWGLALGGTLALAGCSSGSPTASGSPATSGATTASGSPATSGATTASGSPAASGSPTASGAVTASGSPTASAAAASGAVTRRTITVTVDGGQITPAPADVPVAKGEPVRLVVTSATANELHVHGPDLEKALPAGTAVTVDVTFTDAGVYEVETHEPPLRLLRFVVR